MNKFIVTICVLMLLMSGCDSVFTENINISTQEINPSPTPKQTHNINTAGTPTPHAKISSDFKNAPKAEEIKNETGKNISSVLLQDMQSYTIPIKDYFAICLEEDAQKAYRWLLVSEDDLFEYVEETHINGYRVFIFKPKTMGETSILFELSQNSTLVETLSYQIIFS